jgi:hypothetical protein
MKTNKFYLKIAGKILISLVVLALSVLVVFILIKQIDKINATMAEKKEMDYLISNREDMNNKIKTDFMSVDPTYQEKISGSLPSIYNILSFVDVLESLSKKYSFDQKLSFTQPAVAVGVDGPVPLMVINFNLNLEGANIDSFNNYLSDFEKLPYFASIDSISYLGAGTAGWQGNSTINIVGSLYAHE